MAGFAVVMGMLTFGFVGLAAASLLSLLLVQIAKHRLREGSSAVRWQIGLAPFIGLVWIAVAFLIHVFISHHLAHQDCGLGLSPDPFVTLPNGYTLGSHNTYDGYIVAPGHFTDVPVTGSGYVRSIVSLRQVGDQFNGTFFDSKGSKVRRFTFDTKTQKVQVDDAANENDRACNSTVAACVDAWSKANTQAQTGVDSYWYLYRQYQHAWPSYVFLLFVLAGEGALVIYIAKLWRRSKRANNRELLSHH